MNSGKEFEGQWRKNAKKVDGLFFMRLKDSPSSFGTNSKLRFTLDNICDFLMFKSHKLFLLELKNCREASLAFTRLRDNQTQGLLEAKKISPNIVAGIVCNFERAAETYFLDIEIANDFIQSGTRKSIPISFFRENGVLINSKKLRVKYDYDVSGFVDEMLDK